MSVAILLLAAGGSTRMRGGDKLLETLDGEPLLRRSARTALASRASAVLAILGANRQDRGKALADLPLKTIPNKNWECGMGTSIATGIAVLDPRMQAVIVMPADMPDLSPALLDRLIDALPPDAPQTILRPRTEQGNPGNPVLFGADHFPALAALTGDEGARSVIARYPSCLHYVDTVGGAVLTDLDTPEAWSAYRAARKADNNG